MNYPPEWFYNVQHLNLYGSEDFTQYFGKMLVERYGIKPAELTEKQRSQWQEAQKYYHRFYQCCEDKLSKGIEMEINEDLTGIREISKY